MLRLRKPLSNLIRRYLARQATLDFTYNAVGATATSPPAGWTVDHTRIELGEGRSLFEDATSALRSWKQFDLGWMEAAPADTRIHAGETVAVLVRAFGLWWLNAARIVYVVDETTESAKRFGFAYGTLPGHVEAGEERFLVEWDSATDRVSYDIFAFSRPRHILTRMVKSQVRRMQKRFAHDSCVAMRRALLGGRSSC